MVARSGSADFGQDATYINSLLAEVRDIQLTEPSLFRLVNFQVREKGQNDKARFERFFSFGGPDDETISLLHRQAVQWQSQPLCFWNCPSTVTADPHLGPEAQILGMYLRAERDGT